MKVKTRASLRRFQTHFKTGNTMVLAEDHPAVVEGRSFFIKSAGENRRGDHVFVSGHNSRKIGKMCIKGKWSGMPIYTLTLEERKTCPRDCELFRSCYGNRMPWSTRLPYGAALEGKIEIELSAFQIKHPRGFIIRLHVLGDFYSVEYVQKWEAWLHKYPALRVFGYTARHDEIGLAIKKIVANQWDRFAVRSSNGMMAGIPKTKTIKSAADAADYIVCPVQTGATSCCSTCALCFNSTKPIAFLAH